MFSLPSPYKFDSSGSLDVDAELEDVTNFSNDPASDSRCKALPFCLFLCCAPLGQFRFMVVYLKYENGVHVALFRKINAKKMVMGQVI